MMLELAPEQSQRAHDRWAGHVDECAVTLAPVEIKDVLKLVEERRAGRDLPTRRRAQVPRQDAGADREVFQGASEEVRTC